MANNQHIGSAGTQRSHLGTADVNRFDMSFLTPCVPIDHTLYLAHGVSQLVQKPSLAAPWTALCRAQVQELGVQSWLYRQLTERRGHAPLSF